MKEIRLRVTKRIVPGKNRARMNISHLVELGLVNHEKIIVYAKNGKSILQTVYVDSLVNPDEIKMSYQDMLRLGISEGEEVTIQKKIPLKTKLKRSLHDFSGRLSQEIKITHATLSKKNENLQDVVIYATSDNANQIKTLPDEEGDIVHATKENPENGSLISEIQTLLQQYEFNQHVLNRVNHMNEFDLKSFLHLLENTNGFLKTATISSDSHLGKTISVLHLPSATSLIMILRENNSLCIPFPDSEIEMNDILFIIGKEDDVNSVIESLEK